MDFDRSGGDEYRDSRSVPPKAFEEQHHPAAYWARLWGFSAKTIREWFRDEHGPGILRQENSGRRKKRDYTTLSIAPSAARRVYAKHSERELMH
jgi:hypothetical protein